VFRIVGFVVGLAAGAAGATAWLLGEPGSAPSVPASLSRRLELVQTRVEEAVAEGRRAGAESEARLRAELDAYRHHHDRPRTSAAR
jgi:hypothetical protein